MQIEKTQISIRELIKGYHNDEESGQVVAYADENGRARLNIRPKYQREFVYDDKKQAAVIATALWGFPLSIMYWVKNPKGSEYEYELLDGQQRSISICEFCVGNFSLQEMQFKANWSGATTSFSGMPEDQREKFLDYKLDVYVCEGDDSEKLEWFKTINVAGVPLNAQEIRNAIYASYWLDSAKRDFSRKNCKAKQLYDKYLKGEYIKQEVLETALAWQVGKRDEKLITKLMDNERAKGSTDALQLWSHFENIMRWVQTKFTNYRNEMKGLEWGFFYNKYKDKPLDAKALEEEISALMKDSDVTYRKGIYEYVLSGDEKHLNIRAFNDNEKRAAYEKQGGICANSDGSIKGVKCPHENEKLELKEMEADHKVPWSKGGKTEKDNCQMLCRECNRAKGAR